VQKHPEVQLFCNDWTYVRYLRARWVSDSSSSAGVCQQYKTLLTSFPALWLPASTQKASHQINKVISSPKVLVRSGTAVQQHGLWF
jgi:hypothetical protein